MPIFEYNGKKYNVKDEHIENFMKDFPDASTIMERDEKKYRVKSVDYNAFMSELQALAPEQGKPIVQAPKDGVEAIAGYEQKYNKGNAGNDAFAPEGEEIKPEQIVDGKAQDNSINKGAAESLKAGAPVERVLTKLDYDELLNAPRLDDAQRRKYIGAADAMQQRLADTTQSTLDVLARMREDALKPKDEKSAWNEARRNAKEDAAMDIIEQNAKDVVSSLLPGYEEERINRQEKSVADAFALRGASSFGANPYAYKNAVEANQADDIAMINKFAEGLVAKIDSNPEAKEKVEKESARLGVDKQVYIKDVLAPTLVGELSDKWIGEQVKVETESPFVRGLTQAYKNSILGMITSSTNTDTQDYVAQAAALNFEENAGLAEKALSGAASMFVDLPLFSGIGSLASVPAKFIGTKVASTIVAKETARLVAKGVAKSAAERYAKGVAMRSLKNRVLTSLATAPLQSGLTFAGYDAGKEMLRGTLNGDLSASGVLKAGAGGFGMGVGLGLVGAGGSALPLGMRGARKIAAHTGLFALESAVFTEGGRLLQQWHGQEPTEDWLDSYVESALTLGVIKLPGIIKGLRNMNRNKEAQDVFSLTRPEVESLKKYGELSSVIESMLPRAENGQEQSLRGLLEGKVDEAAAEVEYAKVENLNNELLTETFTKVMLDEDVPMSAKAKLVAIATGKMMPAPRVTHARIDGKKIVMLTPTGQIAEIREYSSPKKAQSEYEKMQPAMEVSRVQTAEDMYIRLRAQEDDMNIIRDWVEKNGVDMEEFSRTVARANAGEPLTKAEQKMIKSLQEAKRDAANNLRYLEEIRDDISLSVGEKITDEQILKILSKAPETRTREENYVLGMYQQKLYDYLRERYVQPEEAEPGETEPFEWYAEEGRMLGEAVREPKKYKTAQEVESYVVPKIDGMNDEELVAVSKMMPASMSKPLRGYANRKAKYNEQKGATDDMLQEALHNSELLLDAVENGSIVVEAVVDGKKVYVKKGNIAENNGAPIIIDNVLYVTEDGSKVEQISAEKVEAVKIEDASVVRAAERERVAKQVIEDRKHFIDGWKEFKRGEVYDVLLDGENFELLIIARDENGDIVVSGDGGKNLAHINEYVMQQGVIEAELAKQRDAAIRQFKDGVLNRASKPVTPDTKTATEPVRLYTKGENVPVLLGDDVYNVTVKGYDEKGNVLVDVGFGADEVYSEEELAKMQVAAKGQISAKERLTLVENKIPRGKKGEMLWESASPMVIAEYLRLKKPGNTAAQMEIVQGMIAGIEEQKKGLNPMEAIALDDKIAFWNKVGAMLAPKVEQPQVEQPAVTSEIDALNVKFSPRLGVFNKMLENIRGIEDENLAAKRYAGLENMVADVEKELPEGYMVAVENGKYVIAEREEAPAQVVEPVNAPKNEIQEVKVEAEQTKEPVKEVAPQGEKPVATSGYNVLPVEPVGNGYFGEIYNQFKNGFKAAFDFLVGKKGGEAVGVFNRADVGEIDLVWGDKKGGLSHILEKHVGQGKSFENLEDAKNGIADIVENGEVVFQNGDKVVIKKDDKIVTLRKNVREKGKKIAEKNWILTAYDETKADGTSAISDTNKGQAAQPTVVSADESTTQSANSQENAQESGENRTETAENTPVVEEYSVEKDVIDERRRQNEIAREREQRAGEAPRPKVYADAIGRSDIDAVKAWEDKFKGYLQNLAVDDLPAIEVTIESMQGKKKDIKAGNRKGYKDNSFYKAYDGIEKMLKKRKKELEKELQVSVDSNSTISQETDQVSDQVSAEQSVPVESNSEKPGNLQRDKIEDVGEVLAGARKDMLKVIASAFDNATVQSLIELPFAKAFKKPDLKKAVESGVLREEDALFYETWFNTMINTSKPKLSRRVKSSDIEKWAQQNHDALQVLARFVEADEQARDVLVAEMLKDKYPNRETELAVIEKRKEWNVGSSTVWGDKTTPNPLWVMHETLKKLGAKPGEKLDIPFGVLKANTTGTGYELYNAKNERLVMQGVSSVEEGIEKIVWLAKLKRGDNVAHPMSAFNFKATKSEMVDSGRYRVMWGSGLNAQDRVFNSKEEAEQFASTRKSKTYIYPVQVPGRYYGYKITFRNPLTGDVVLADETAFETKGEAEQFLQENYDAINEKVNGELAKAKGESKKELSADDVLDIAMVYDNAWKYAVNIKKEYANNMGMPSILKEFNTRAEAKAYLDEVKEEIFKGVKKAIEDKKAFVYFDTGENSRIGEDYRGGKDVTAEDFMNEFGFRGVQFGNWTNQADRQMAVNQAYDAFLDLAKLIGVSPKALSLNGELGIAFGSRGSGKFAAHYEPGEIVINLTKTRGAGSLAHEWWHALDNYFARRADVPGGMVTDSKNLQMREELREAYNALLRQIENSDYMQRSVSQGDYWGRMHEVTARLLAEWVDQSLKKNGEVNTFLSRGVNEDKYKLMNYEGYTIAMKTIGKEPMPYEEFAKTDKALAGFPYPTKEEVQEFGDAMRNVFDVMQEDATDDGKVALFSIAANTMGADMGTDAFERATERTVGQLKNIGVPVEIATEEQARVMGAFGFSTTKEEFRARAQAAKEQAGIVAHGLIGQELPITQVEKHSFTGNLKNARQEAKSWAENNFVGKEYDMPEGGGKYIITKRAIGKYVDKTAVEKSENPGVHLSALVKFPEIISNSVDAEIHPDYNRGEDGVRRRENGISNEDMLVHRLYGAIEIDGKVYRVKTTMHEFLNGNDANSPHSYEVTQIELIEDSTVAPTNEAHNPLNRSTNSISATKLLNGVEKSYDKGKKLLDESKDAPERMVVYHGSGAKFDRFDHSFMGTGEGAQVYGVGTYVTEIEGIGRSYADAANRTLFKSATGASYLEKIREGMQNGKSFEEVKRELLEQDKSLYEERKDDELYKLFVSDYERLRTLKEEELSKRYLYTVDIPEDDGSNYLHWDKYIDSAVQERVIEGLLSLGFQKEGDVYEKDGKFISFGWQQKGDNLFYGLVDVLGGYREASDFLSNIGVTGISYPAQVRSGGRKDGARNYVIFNDNDLQTIDRVEFMRTPKGAVYGWAVNGKVYLTPAGLNPDTPVHEYTHLWASAVEKNDPGLWREIVESMKASPVWNEVLTDENYRDIWNNENRVASEVLSRLSGRENYKREMERAREEIERAENPIEAAEKITALERLKRALQAFWEKVKSLFRGKKGTPLSPADGSPLKNGAVEQWMEFAEMPLNDFWAGVKPDVKGREVEMMGSRVDARMAEVASRFDGKELSPEKRAVVDVFGGKADNLTISVKTDGGNERKVVMRQGNEMGAGAKHSLYRHYETGNGVITAEDILLIPEVLANGKRTESGKKFVYESEINGVVYKVVTEKVGNKEIFNNFYTNKKTSDTRSSNTLAGVQNRDIDTFSSARMLNSDVSTDKGSNNSSNVQEGAEFAIGRYDLYYNEIGDGSWHVPYEIDDIALSYPNISHRVSKSSTTESVYVTYVNNDPKYPEWDRPKAVVRFSNHTSNAVEYGDQIPGSVTNDERLKKFRTNELLVKLGLKKSVPVRKKLIENRAVSNKDLKKGVYEEADKTMQELYELPVGTDISQYQGKLAKGSRYLILGDKIVEGDIVGHKFEDIPGIEPMKSSQSEAAEFAIGDDVSAGPVQQPGEPTWKFKARKEQWQRWVDSHVSEKTPMPIAPEMREGESEVEYEGRVKSFFKKLDKWGKEVERKDGEIERMMNVLYDGKTTPKKTEAQEFTERVFKSLGGRIDVTPSEVRGYIKDEIINRRKMIEANNLEDVLFIDKIRNMTTPEERKAIPFIIEGTYNGLVSPELRQLVVTVREWFERVYQMLQSADAMNASQKIRNYVTHIWDKQRTPKQIYESYINTRSKYTNRRSIETYAEGIAMGMVPKYDDICDIMLEYGHVANEALGNKYFIDFLHLLDVDGAPVLKDVDTKDPMYVKINSNAIEKYKVHKNAKRLVECVLGSADSLDIPYLSAVARGWDLMGSAMKRINLSCSFFHHGALTETAVGVLGPKDIFPVVLKNILWDSLNSGKAPALNNPEAARRAVKHLVQLGATADYVAKETGRYTEKLKKWAEDFREEHKYAGAPAEWATSLIDFLNAGNDRILWDFLHDGLKIYAFEKLARDIDTMCEAKGIKGIDKEMLLDEAGQFVNDTFGGQFWELIDVTPMMLKWLKRGLLSPDWTISTLRQALSPLGYGALYADYNAKWWQKPLGLTYNENGNSFSEKYLQSSQAVKMRRKMGFSFWATALTTFMAAINALNAWRRAVDVDRELEKAKEKRKSDPTYRSPYELKYPDGMKWYDYTMYGNTLGHKTHLFWGRYEDETEIYSRWGKQFRELPELFIGPDGFAFPGPMISKLLGKTNPALQGFLAFCGYSLDGYVSKYMKNKTKWNKEVGRVQEILSRMLPYVVPVDTDKEWVLMDMILPTTKGISNYKAMKYFKAAVTDGDMDLVAQVYDAAVMNHLDAEKLLKSAIVSIEAEVRKDRVDGIESLNDAWGQYNESDVPRKKAIRKLMMRTLEEDRYKDFEREDAVRAAEEFLMTGELNSSKRLPDIYIANETNEDVRDDFMVTKIRLATKKIKEQADGITDENAWKEFEKQHGDKMQLYNLIGMGNRVISQIKTEMEINPQDAQMLMQEIRDIRREIINYADSIDVKVTLTDKGSNKDINM